MDAKDFVKKWLNGKELTKDESRKLDTIKQSADLIINYGKKGAICLAGRGRDLHR